jgi:hypothetical protein
MGEGAIVCPPLRALFDIFDSELADARNPLFRQLVTCIYSQGSARPRSNWNAAAHTELLPRSWNF